MGNRGTVIFTDGKSEFSPAVYLHWNGGPESVYGFLEELDTRQVRADQDYECARFIQIVGQFMDADGQGGLSLGVANGPASVEDVPNVATDTSDNGIYLVQRTYEGPTIVRRWIENYMSREMSEMSPEAVEREHRQALASDYRPALRAFFDTLRKVQVPA